MNKIDLKIIEKQEVHREGMLSISMVLFNDLKKYILTKHKEDLEMDNDIFIEKYVKELVAEWENSIGDAVEMKEIYKKEIEYKGEKG